MARRVGGPREYRTNIGILIFGTVEEPFGPLLQLLQRSPRPAWQLEEQLAVHFELNKREREAVLKNGHRAWENHVAWALGRLKRRRSVTKFAPNRPLVAGGIYGRSAQEL